MSGESLARAEADLIDTLRRLHRCRRELDECRHDAAAVARLQVEIDALVALKESARQLRDAEHSMLEIKSGEFASSIPDEVEPCFRFDKITQRYKRIYCQRTPESNTRLSTLVLVFGLCLWYFIVQLQKVNTSYRHPLVQSTQTPRDVITSPSVFVCDGTACSSHLKLAFLPESCFYGGFSHPMDCTPEIKFADVAFPQWGSAVRSCLILPSVTMRKDSVKPVMFFSFTANATSVDNTLLIGTLQNSPPQDGFLLADTMDFSSSKGVTLLNFAPKSYTYLNGSVTYSSETFVSNSPTFL